MAIPDVSDEYFTYEGRLASFQTAQKLSKRRGSNASTKAPKSLKWPHKFLSPEELARAGFFFYPSEAYPDNCACFLCHKSIDGWVKGDDPLVEHLRLSEECGWAIVATIGTLDGVLSMEYPSSTKMIEARKATFANRWPHESKKGWKCKTKQMVDAGWKYTPTAEYDDMATCTYCELALDGWEPGDKPLDEHFKRSPECAFFTLINNKQQSPVAKRTKAKKDRTSKVSRLSTQSAFTVASDTASVTDLAAEEGDSVLTTATNMTATKKIGKGKKATTAKGRKTKAKKSEAVEVVPTPEPEDDDFEVKVDLAPKPTKGKKRKTEDLTDVVSAVDIEAPPPKRRVTRARASSVAANDTVIAADESSLLAPNPIGRKKGRQSTRKVSTASVASLRAPVPNDEELDAALEADLERMTDEEPQASTAKTSRQSRAAKADHAMFGTEPIEIDEAAIDAELKEMEAASKPLPMAKGAAKGKQPRKPSAKQQAAAAKKAAEAEAAAQRTAEEEDEASQQIAMELEHSISIQHSSPISQPIVQPKRQRATSRQPSRHMPERRTRGSVMSLDDSKSSLADDQGNLIMDGNEDSGNDTDASQSTVVRGGQTRRGSTMNNGKGKAASRNIEKIVRKAPTAKFPHLAVPGVPDHEEDASMIEERFYTPAPEPHIPVVEDHPLPEVPKPKAAKARGRPPKAAPATALGGEQANAEVDSAGEVPTLIPAKAHKVKVATPHRSPTPPPKQRTPSQSPQSSDAENHPPSTKPSASIRKAVTPHANTTRVPLAATTPSMSPSKRNIIAGLVTTHPWTSVHLDALFLKSPGSENAPGTGLFGAVLDKAKNGDLTSPEKKMTVGEWIKYNAEMAEEKLRSECERMVGRFESEGTRAMRALEGIECIE